ncbi:class I SAM-dependent methyltransferase [Kribbella speibonae]|uniref:Class I SAM-dependent methyltransferase n=1 Tax=Kribbella speibonae TaxID=1572660 RepID=A0A4R0JES8_9ACTN|nr:class I SAM-dependent methyltransferase [Kribbella speibonae]TCC16233.1 class I SAM-dependent methyltransferase [Kribbella speibonae]TCC40155.1 class I SAM-dependent methyltransferase [Kribbella speibonae]
MNALYDDPAFLDGYRRLRQSGQALNEPLEIPAMDAALPPVAGARVVDLGCGEGGLAVRLAEAGAAEVLAVDVSEQMLAAARPHAAVRYECADLADFDVPAGSVDLVVSSMALHYVGDFDDLVARVARWLVPGGWLVFTMEHPVMTAPVVAADCVVDDYADEGRRERTWFVDGVIKYHRTIGTVFGTLHRHGLQVERLDEPMPNPEQVVAQPSLAVHRRRPPILLIAARVR